MKRGKVIFVGAGPGADDLITVRGSRAIAEADIVIWASSLVHPGIVAGARPDALVVDSASEALEDTAIHYRRAAEEGLTVARVHTGDPSIYGATGEQYEMCRQLGLDYETIPGVSAYSATAARMNAEITIPEVSGNNKHAYEASLERALRTVRQAITPSLHSIPDTFMKRNNVH